MDLHIVFTPTQTDIPSLSQVFDCFQSLTEASRIIVSQEVSKKTNKVHFHSTLTTQVRPETIRARIKNKYRWETVSVCNRKGTLDSCVQYTLKDKNYRYWGFEDFYILAMDKLSYRKEEVIDKFDKDIEHRIAEYLKDTSPYADVDFYEEVCKLYCKYNRKFVWAMIDKLYIMAKSKKDQRFLRDNAIARIQQINNVRY